MQEDFNADDAPLYLLYIVQMLCLGHIQVLTPPQRLTMFSHL